MSDTLNIPKKAGVRPVRLITYAWGREYVDNLLRLTLPAVLAPGNLPALAENFPCEFVFLTEREHFEHVQTSRVFQRLKSVCPARLIAIDDLVITTSAYGHSLTWTLFRGFEDLGDAASETNLLFFNADWIPADGSYRSLIAPLEAGARLIVAPSYCVREEAVAPLLKSQLDVDGTVLSVPPRQMAEIAIRYRHNTVRGKTLNEGLFHMDVMDQFYLSADSNTMLCRQMPIAIVCMRPERVLREPRTFWDYGTVSELCPTTTPVVLGDSDAFLMIELRSHLTYANGLAFGPARRPEVIHQLASFTTKDHRDYGRHTLVLHSSDLPPSYPEVRAAFDRYVDDLLDDLPPPVAHQDHPYWSDMAMFFDTIRSGYAESMKNADSHSGLVIRETVLRDEITFLQESVRENLHDFRIGKTEHGDWARRQGLIKSRAFAAASALDLVQDMHEQGVRDLKLQIQQTVTAIEAAKRLDASIGCTAALSPIAVAYFDSLAARGTLSRPSRSELALAGIAVRQIKEALANTIKEVVAKRSGDLLPRLARASMEVSAAGHTANILQAKGGRAIAQMRAQFNELSTAIAEADRVVTGGRTEYAFMESKPPSNRNVVFAAFDPLAAHSHKLRRLLKYHTAASQSILTVWSDHGGFARGTIARFPGRHFSIHMEALEREPEPFPKGTSFDICICDFSSVDAHRFGNIFERIHPYMRASGRVILSAVNSRAGLRPFVDDVKQPHFIGAMFPSADDIDVFYSGNWITAAAIGLPFGIRALASRAGYKLPRSLVTAIGAPLSLLAHFFEKLQPIRRDTSPPKPLVAVTICAPKLPQGQSVVSYADFNAASRFGPRIE